MLKQILVWVFYALQETVEFLDEDVLVYLGDARIEQDLEVFGGVRVRLYHMK